ETTIRRGVCLNETVDICQYRAHFCGVAVAQQPEIYTARVHGIDTGDDRHRRRQASTREAVEPARKSDRFIVIRYIQRCPLRQLTIGRGKVLEELCVDVGCSEKNLAKAHRR